MTPRMRVRGWLPPIVAVASCLWARNICEIDEPPPLSNATWLHPEGIAIVFRSLVTDEECKVLVTLAAEAGFAPSTVFEKSQVVSDARTAKTSFVLTGYWRSKTHAAVAARIVRHFAMLPSEARRIAAGGSELTEAHLEDLQSTQYDPGDAYRHHVDGEGQKCCSSDEQFAGDSEDPDAGGCRMHTALLYCTTNPSVDGGATSFLFPDGTSVSVSPERDSVVMFPADIWHASEPLQRGKKQIFNFWALCKPEAKWSYYVEGALDRMVDAIGRLQLEAWLDVDLIPLRKSR